MPILFQITDLDEEKDFIIRHMQIYNNFMLFGKQRYATTIIFWILFFSMVFSSGSFYP